MKNPVRVIVINLVLAVVLIGMLVGATFIDELNSASITLGGISFGFGSDHSAYIADNSYERGEGSVKASEVESLDVAWLSGSVQFVPSSDDTIRIRESCNTDLEEDEIMRWKLENGRLSIRFASKVKVVGNMPEKALTVEIPSSDWQVDYAEIQTVSANAELFGLNAYEFSFDSVSGALDADSIVGEEIDCATVSGSIHIDKLECGSLTVDSVSGNTSIKEGNVTELLNAASTSGTLNFTGAVRSVEWDTTSGDAKMIFTAAPKNIEADSTSGDVTITLPEDIGGFKAELDSMSGELTSDFEISHNGDYVQYGDRSIMIEMDTLSGDLHIKKAE